VRIPSTINIVLVASAEKTKAREVTKSNHHPFTSFSKKQRSKKLSIW
jgi:hypothetical protein